MGEGTQRTKKKASVLGTDLGSSKSRYEMATQELDLIVQLQLLQREMPEHVQWPVLRQRRKKGNRNKKGGGLERGKWHQKREKKGGGDTHIHEHAVQAAQEEGHLLLLGVRCHVDLAEGVGLATPHICLFAVVPQLQLADLQVVGHPVVPLLHLQAVVHIHHAPIHVERERVLDGSTKKNQ